MLKLDSRMTVQEFLRRHPDVGCFFVKHNMDCPGCPTEAFHMLSDVARHHGWDVEALLAALRSVIESESPSGCRQPERSLSMNAPMLRECAPVEISEQDVLGAMKTLQGYIDITPADFREVYRAAYALAKQRMLQALKAGDVMSTPVHCVAQEADLVATATLLADRGISGAPVVDAAGKIVGVVSEKDFLARMGGAGGSFMQVVAHCLKNKGCVATPLTNRTVRDIMSAPPVTATAQFSIGEIAAQFTEKKINRLPIVGEDARPVGIVTRSDLVNAYCMLG